MGIVTLKNKGLYFTGANQFQEAMEFLGEAIDINPLQRTPQEILRSALRYACMYHGRLLSVWFDTSTKGRPQIKAKLEPDTEANRNVCAAMLQQQIMGIAKEGNE